ncbi:MAG: alpha/beta fold hydrolase [Leptolyngbya sp. SIO3F4]|nr:alpha/beta fold hydrolase [Leptolyngbya sp. SIO3F4]
MNVLWCLHGNLQQPLVWNFVRQHFQGSDVRVETVSLWDTLSDDPWSWSRSFCESVSLLEGSNNHYLLGYSLGGRLGFHALIRAPLLWTGAIIVSADPGTSDIQVRERAWERDRIWASRFLTESWQPLLAEWDALPVFCGRPCLTPRPESAFDRKKIAHAFEAYSKGHMDDLAARLCALEVPITYIAGSDDHRYCHLGESLQTHGANLDHVQIDAAGHRVPWEQPDAFLRLLRNVLAF